MKINEIRDISPAPSGRQKIEWVKDNMPLLRGLAAEYGASKPFAGVRISLSVHL
ncbi:MAG: adenosylhomocysteinase, partial [Clostridiales Family XIII bacterium]|nr:adenosylhomocysteinase [Clostridiales Family XIII bacterium]